MEKSLKNFFYPSSVCIVGASSKPGSIGYEITKTILGFGYKGELLLVNPKGEELFGISCYTSINEIEKNIDLAVIVVPKPFVEDSVDQLIGKNVKSVILITAGFKETGKEGEEIEKRILDKIKSSGTRMVGPNCMGVINALPETMLNATFVAERPEPEALAFLSQSGALGAAVLNSLRESGIKFSHFISVGNKADINENDMLKLWTEDENIKIISMYLESFSDGTGFIDALTESKNKKPVLILKAGRTQSGIKAASSHTGALGSSDNVVDTVLEQFGAIRVKDLNEMFNTAKGYLNFPLPKGKKGAVITNAGGPAILAVDKIEEEGLELASLSEDTKLRIKEIIHPEGSANNPIDLLPNGDAASYKKVIEILLEDKEVDFIISIFVEPVMVKPFDVVESINSIHNQKPILQVVMPLPEFWQKYKAESHYSKPLFKNPEEPAIIIKNLLKINKNVTQKRLSSSGRREGLSKEELITEYNLPLLKERVYFFDELKENNINYPCVIKGVTEKDIHKSDLGVVRLNIRNHEELINNAREIRDIFTKNNLLLKGFLVQPYVKVKNELLVGGFRDPNFGPMIMFGSGGKYVEQLNDTALISAYLSDEDITTMINKTKIGNILKGVRGEQGVNFDELKGIIMSVAKILLENDKITEFEINPLAVTEENKLYCLDIRIVN